MNKIDETNKERSFRIEPLFAPETGFSPEILDFIGRNKKANWFTYNYLLPPVISGGNATPFLILAYVGGHLSGVLVSMVYSRRENDAKQEKPFRIQVNGEPMVEEASPEAGNVIRRMISSLIDFADRNRCEIEFRNFFASVTLKEILISQNFIFHPHLNLLKPLSSADQAWASFSKCRRRQIKKSIRNGTTVAPPVNDAQVLAFYRILKELYDFKVHKTVPPPETFLDFYHRCEITGDGIILLVFAGEEVIGGIVCLIEQDKKIYEWYICGRDQEFQFHYPSVMATWGAIEYACYKNIPLFDFLGLGKPDVPYGVREFKLRFGGEVSNIGRFIRHALQFS